MESRLYDDTVSQIGREIHQNGSRSPQVQMSGFISYMRNLQLKGYLLWSVGLCKLKRGENGNCCVGFDVLLLSAEFQTEPRMLFDMIIDLTHTSLGLVLIVGYYDST